MANTNSVQHAQTVAQVGSNSNLSIAWGFREIAAAQSAADTVTFFTLPAGTTVFGGKLVGDDLDTGTEALEIDVGDSGDPDRFINSGVITGDAVTGTKPEAGIALDLFGTLKDGPHTYSADTDIIGTFTAAANSGGTGSLWLYLLVSYNDVRVTPPTKPL